ncbi:MAG: GNAT family N-acetyltransferase [Victivallales bacterium]|nr:GNAT family N-acetyltransferase [Victivallales bacterium]
MYKLDFKKFPSHIIHPTVLAESEKFQIKIAETEEEIQKTLRLRYNVFNIEQGKGLEQASGIQLDFDEFDEYCLQLIVLNKHTNEPVGTYRIHLGHVAASSSQGFYSAGEYDIEGLDKIAHLTMEVGRSCVLSEFRTGAAVALLWGGIGELMMRAKLRYLLGCVSLEKNNAAATWAVYEHLKENNMVTDTIVGTPKQGYVLERPPQKEIDKYRENIKNTLREYVPPLFKGYLRLGTKVCGLPLYDPEFHTVDFLILLDSYTVPERYAKHYNYKASK